MTILNINIEKALGTGKVKLNSPKSLQDIPKKVTKTINDLLEDKPRTKLVTTFGIKDYEDLREKAVKGIDTNAIMNLGLAEEGNEDLLVLVTEFNELLQSIIPQNLSTTLFAIDEKPPSHFEQSKFVRQMRTLLDPAGHLLDLISAGALSGLEVQTVRDFFPELYQAITSAALEALAAKQGGATSPLTIAQNRTLSTLLEMPRLSPAILDAVTEEEGGEADFSTSAESSSTDIQNTLNR